DGIEEEAEAVSQEAWEVFMSAPGTGDEDPANFAEAAEQIGVSRYLLLDGIRQGMLNLFAAALYHAFEQQVMRFHRKQVLHPREENNPNFFKMHEFRKRVRDYGIDITTFSSWPKVDELRLVANAVKHAEGDSVQKLHSLRPDLFEHPQLKEFPALAIRGTPRVFQPLVGADLYVSLEDIHNYRNTLLEFWEELSHAIQCV